MISLFFKDKNKVLSNNWEVNKNVCKFGATSYREGKRFLYGVISTSDFVLIWGII